MKNVRLTTQEIEQIIAAGVTTLGENLREVRLYGSRCDLEKAGGDIDLIFEIQEASNDKFLDIQRLRSELVRRLGEQKFDILIICENKYFNSERENNFYELISKKSKILWTTND